MSLFLPWVIFPLVLVLVGAGWGALVELAAGSRVNGVLVVPLGWAAVIVFTLLLTEWSVTAPATVTLVAIATVAGLGLARSRFSWSQLRHGRWPALAAFGVFLIYGAPVLAYGQATFTGIVRLDDTSTWLNIIDHAMTHLHPAIGTPVTSSYQLAFTGDVGPTYPLGAFMLPALGHVLTGIDAVWVVQPYMALCGAAVGLGAYALVQPVIQSPRIRALIAFVAAQPALLYGYSLWGGDKELAAAFLLILGVALLARAIDERPQNARGLLPLAIAAGALTDTLSVGAVAWAGPALFGMVIVWAYRARPEGLGRPALKLIARDLSALGMSTAVLMLPVWLTLSSFLSERSKGLFTSSNKSMEEAFGNLLQPLSGWQLAGIWPVGDFRHRAPTLASVLLIGCALIAAVTAVWLTVRRRRFSVIAYVAVTLLGCGIFYLINTTPWVLGKALAISSPALLLAAATGAGMLWGHRRKAVAATGALAMAAIAGGVIWSNVLAYGHTTLAPHARLAELEHLGELVKDKGPTLINEYEVYADRHFLREGEPVEPAEYRPVTLPLREGYILTKSAWSQLNAFPLSTLLPYRSIVTRRMPSETRPPSIYNLVWQGTYYQLWQRPQVPTTHILEMVPYGESNTYHYCGVAENAKTEPLCPIDPVSVPTCPQVQSLARKARAEHARLEAYESPVPTFAYGDEVLWPGSWSHEPSAHVLHPLAPGTAIGHLKVRASENYELWLYGSFGRGFEVSVDGHAVGAIRNQLSGFGAWLHVTNLFLSRGVHAFAYTYPSAGIEPASAENEYTALNGVLLQPQIAPGLINLSPEQATQLCGHPLQWIEVVTAA